FHLQVPRTGQAGLDRYLRVLLAQVERSGLGLFPLLAIGQDEAATLAEAGELPGDGALDRLLAAEVEEAAVLADHFLAAFLARLRQRGPAGAGIGLRGRLLCDLLDLAMQPVIEAGQF